MKIAIEKDGSLIIPKDFIKTAYLHSGDEVELVTANRRCEFSVKKLTESCVFCGTQKELTRMGRSPVCRRCIERLYESEPGETLYPGGSFMV